MAKNLKITLNPINDSTNHMNPAHILRAIHNATRFSEDYGDPLGRDHGLASDQFEGGQELKQKRLGRGRGSGKTMTGLKYSNGKYWCRLSVGTHRFVVNLWTDKPETALRRRRILLDLIGDEDWLAQMLEMAPSSGRAVGRKRGKTMGNIHPWQGKAAGAPPVRNHPDSRYGAAWLDITFEKEA